MTEQNWNLEPLYKSFDAPEFANDIKYLKESIESIKAWSDANLSSPDDPAKKLEYYINFQNIFGDKASRLYDFAELSLSVNSNDELAVKYTDIIEDILSELTSIETAFVKWLDTLIDVDALLNTSTLLKEHSFFVKEILKQNSHTLSPEEETIISKLKNTGSSAWEKLQDSITSTLSIPLEIDNTTKTYTLAGVRNLAYENNQELRKKAYDAEIKALESIAPVSAACLNGIKGEVITVANLKKYSSPLEMTLLDSRMDKETLDALISTITDNIHIFHSYFIKKAKILGHKNGLPFYDLFAPIGSANMKFSYNDAKELIVDNFNKFSPELSSYAHNAFKNNWIDLYPYDGKRGGAFCANLHSIGESRILTNFTGSFNDVITLAHELGHGYHGAMLDKETYLNCDYPMPIAETASTFCETIVKNALLKTVSKEQAEVILENDISDNAQILVDIMSRFIFEDSVFNLRKDGSLSVTELCNLMLDAQNKTYGVGLDKDYMHKYMWVCKPHYYDADYNYYNFPYAFGLLFAKGLYSLYLEKGNDFCGEYNGLLAATGKNDLYTVAKLAGIDIHSKDFWQSSVNIMKSDIDKFV